MLRRLHHPLWAHLPALALLIYMFFVMASAWPWPASTAVHFGASGRPDRMGSPWEPAIAFTLISMFFLGMSIVIDEHWARTERRKRFNWASLLDEAVIALMATLVSFQFGEALREGMNARFDLRWTAPLYLANFGAVGLAAILEMFRPWRPAEDLAAVADSKVAPDPELIRRMRQGGRWAYFESQNPAWIWALCLAGAAAVLFGAYQLVRESLIGAALLAIVGVVIVLVIGGLRVFVSADGLRVRLGLLGVRLLRLGVGEIAEVTVHQFSPIADFGGWGIRRGQGMTAFFFRGNRGVQLVTRAGKKYLIGSDTPERLASVLEAFKTLT
jgi:hypothetical protein